MSSTSIPHPKTVPELADTLGTRLLGPYRKLRQRLYAELEKDFPDIRQAYSNVFRHLTPDGSRLTDLAERADMTKQSMSYLVEQLTDKGYLKVEPHPDDRRAQLVKPTARGQKFLKAAVASSARVERELAARIGERKITQLRSLLAELGDALDA